MQIFEDFFAWSKDKLNYKEILNLISKNDEIDTIRTRLFYAT